MRDCDLSSRVLKFTTDHGFPFSFFDSSHFLRSGIALLGYLRDTSTAYTLCFLEIIIPSDNRSAPLFIYSKALFVEKFCKSNMSQSSSQLTGPKEAM